MAKKDILIGIIALCAMAAMPSYGSGLDNTPGPGVKYATDAYPGFDNEDSMLKPEKKTPRWFSFIYGPKMHNAPTQLEWARKCEEEGSFDAARRAYDALVREWPSEPEAAIAQKALADLELNHYLDYDQAFAEYQYLLDFHSLECDYKAVSELMYKVAEMMREEGKTIMFFRFRNTVDVRRAYEALVLRSPGASFIPQALLTIGELREDEGKPEVAITVYGNLRNLYPESEEAIDALYNEGWIRRNLLDEHAYNRHRTDDTIRFYKLAIRNGKLDSECLEDFKTWLAEAEEMIDNEAFKAAKFYDSNTRTRHSAVSAYERYLVDYPAGIHADEAREALERLKGTEKKIEENKTDESK